jgi:hypothetical protein
MMTLKNPWGPFVKWGRLKQNPLCEIHHLKFWVEKDKISLKKILVPNSISSYLRVVLYPK